MNMMKVFKMMTAIVFLVAMTTPVMAGTKECDVLTPWNKKVWCEFFNTQDGITTDANVSVPDVDVDTNTGKDKNGNNGHGNDPDRNDDSNPGKSNSPNDNTDADGTPGKSKNF